MELQSLVEVLLQDLFLEREGFLFVCFWIFLNKTYWWRLKF